VLVAVAEEPDPLHLDRLAVQHGEPAPSHGVLDVPAGVVVPGHRDDRVVPEVLGQRVDTERLPALPGRGVVTGVDHQVGLGVLGHRGDHRVHPDVVVPVRDQQRELLVRPGLAQLVRDTRYRGTQVAVQLLRPVVGVHRGPDQPDPARGGEPGGRLDPVQPRVQPYLGQQLAQRPPLGRVHVAGPQPVRHQYGGDRDRHRDHDRECSDLDLAGAQVDQPRQLGAAYLADRPPPDHRQYRDEQPGPGTGDRIVDRHVDDHVVQPADLTVRLAGDQRVPGEQVVQVAGVGLLDVDVETDPERQVGVQPHPRQHRAEVERDVAVMGRRHRGGVRADRDRP
jgi:hypothetical protein